MVPRWISAVPLAMASKTACLARAAEAICSNEPICRRQHDGFVSPRNPGREFPMVVTATDHTRVRLQDEPEWGDALRP